MPLIDWHQIKRRPQTPYLVSSDYDFSPITPGGSLSAGVPATVTISPVSAGVNGTDAFHPLWISGGTGTPEAVTITGGTAVAGAAIGTITFTPTNSHTGSWSLRSATAGIMEALISMARAWVVVPAGAFAIRATITPPQGSTIEGSGIAQSSNTTSSTELDYYGAAGSRMLDLRNDQCALFHLHLVNKTTPGTAGGVGVYAGSSSAWVEDVEADFFYNGFYFYQQAMLVAKDLISASSVGDGFVWYNTGGSGCNCLATFSGGNGHYLTGGISPLLSQVLSFNNGGWGVKVLNATVQIDTATLQADYLGSMSVKTNYGAGGQITNLNLQSAGTTNTHGTTNNSPGLRIEAASQPVQVTNVQIEGATGNGIELLSSNCSVSSVWVQGTGTGGQAGYKYSLYVTGATNSVHNLNAFLAPAYINGANNIITGCFFINNTSTASIEFGASATDTTFNGNCIGNTVGYAIVLNSGASFVQGSNSITIGAVNGTWAYSTTATATPPIRSIPVPSALTISANAITVSLPAHHVGAGLIKTINGPANFQGSVQLIADAAFTTDTTGNIASSAMTAVVYRVYTATFDAAYGKWFLSA